MFDAATAAVARAVRSAFRPLAIGGLFSSGGGFGGPFMVSPPLFKPATSSSAQGGVGIGSRPVFRFIVMNEI
jgi:hypothetical protein